MIETISEGGVILFDFNRTLQNTVAYSESFNNFVAQKYPEIAGMIVELQVAEETNGGSFDAFAVLHTMIGTEAFEEFKNDFKKHTRSEGSRFLNPGAEEVLETLGEIDVPHAILTTGSVPNQKYQLEVSQLDHVPHYVVDRRDKAKMMSEEGWIQPDGMIKVPAEIAFGGVGLFSYALLVDDKAIAFKDAPDGIVINGEPRGFFGNYFVDPNREQLVSQLGEVPSNVIKIDDLRNIRLPGKSE